MLVLPVICIKREFSQMENNEQNLDNPFVEAKEETQEETQEKASELQEEIQTNEIEEKLKKEIEDINNKYLRLAADFDNYRKRQAQERENLIKYGAEETLKKIIPVLDNLERAKNSIEKTEDINVVKQSFEVCAKQLDNVLEKIGLVKIEVKGKEFDPNIMEAVMKTPTDEVEPNIVIAELQAGYRLYDRVLRPTMVNVATEKE